MWTFGSIRTIRTSLGDNGQPAGVILARSTRERGWRGFAPARNGGLAAALLLSLSFVFLASGPARAETRTLKLYFIHTKERAEITYKRNGKFIPSGLSEVNRFLRDWRRNEPTKMDPRLLDLLWQVYQSAGARDYIHVVSAYRSPATNSMLRSRSKGVAEKSQHMLGKAIDFYIPGVKLANLRATALKYQSGGVGYYPTSGSPFVHLDVGNVRHWPRMKRSELMALFPDGKTLHIPSDGKPLPGFKQALAAYQSRKQSGATIQLASVAESEQPRRGFLARLFGGADEEEDSSESRIAAAPAPQPAAEPRRPEAPAAAEPQPSQNLFASLPARAVPLPQAAPRPLVDVGAPLQAAAAQPAAQLAAAQPAAQPAAEAAAESLVALDVPLPIRRPAYQPPAEEPAGEMPVQVAAAGLAATRLAAAGDDIITGKVAAPAEPSATLAAYVPLASDRPSGEAEVMIAALPQGGSPLGLERGAAPSGKEARIARAQAEEIVDERLARLASAPSASPRLALIARESGIAPETVIASGPKTTTKAARPGPADGAPDPRSVPIPVPLQVARWALSNQPVLLDTRGTTAPSFAHAAVRSAPQVVYTAGFQAAAVDEQPNRFTGKAVQFLSVARFTN